MLFAPFIAPVLSFLLRDVIVKFVILTAVFSLVAVFIPVVINLISPFLGVSSLSSVFSAIPAGVWYFADFFNIGFGLPLLISAYVARFIIRRLPFIG